MGDNVKRSRLGAFMRYLMLLLGTVASVGLASPGAASAQTAFQADAAGTLTRPAALEGGCSSEAFFCGTADIVGFGAASWNFFQTGATIVHTSCGSTYMATTDLTLASDGSTLVLNESGNICLPGSDGSSFFSEPPLADGHPFFASGTWTVDGADSTGQFAGLSGSGTTALQTAGAHTSESYTGTLGP